MSLIASFCIVNFGRHFFVKMYIFIIGCGFGLIFADMTSRTLIKIWDHFCGKRVELDEEDEEQSKKLIDKGQYKDKDDDDDDDVENDDENDDEDDKKTATEIELQTSTITRV